MAKRPRVLRKHPTRDGEMPLMHPREIDGRHIKLIRAALAMSVSEFAESVGVAATTISNIENYGSPNTETLHRIAAALQRIEGLNVLKDAKSIGVRVDYRKLRRHGAKSKIKPMGPNEFRGRLVNIARGALSMTIREFAEFVGVAYNTISSIENYGSPNSDTVDGIAAALRNIDDVLELHAVDCKTISVRVSYEEIEDVKKMRARKIREFRKIPEPDLPVDPDWMYRGSILYPRELAEKYDAEQAERMRQHELACEARRDKRVGKRIPKAETTKNGGKPKPPQGVLV